MSNTKCSWLGLLTTTALLALPSHAFSQVGSLVRTGDVLPGFGTVTEVGQFAVNDSGEWVASVKTDFFGSDSAVILLNGSILAYLGDPALGGVSPEFSNQLVGLDIDDAGNVAWLAVDASQPAPKRVAFVNTLPYVTEGAVTGIPSVGPLVVWSSLRALRLDPTGSGKLYASLSITGSGAGLDSGPALVEVFPNGAGGLDANILANSEDDLPGLADWIGLLSELPRTTDRIAVNGNGQLLVPAGVFDSGIFLKAAGSQTFQAVALEGDSAPHAGAAWFNFLGSSVALNDSSGVAYTGFAEDALGVFQTLVLNGGSVARTGETLPGIAPYVLTEICNPVPGSSAPLALTAMALSSTATARPPFRRWFIGSPWM